MHDLIVRLLSKYSTNSSPCFNLGVSYYFPLHPVDPNKTYYEVSVDGQLDNYHFLAAPAKHGAPKIKKEIQAKGFGVFRTQNHKGWLTHWQQQVEPLDWHRPPTGTYIAVVVPYDRGLPDWSRPALFLYQPKLQRAKKARLPKLPKGTGPLAYRL